MILHNFIEKLNSCLCTSTLILKNYRPIILKHYSPLEYGNDKLDYTNIKVKLF